MPWQNYIKKRKTFSAQARQSKRGISIFSLRHLEHSQHFVENQEQWLTCNVFIGEVVTAFKFKQDKFDKTLCVSKTSFDTPVCEGKTSLTHQCVQASNGCNTYLIQKTRPVLKTVVGASHLYSSTYSSTYSAQPYFKEDYPQGAQTTNSLIMAKMFEKPAPKWVTT